MFVWLLHFKGFFLYALLFYMKNVGCGPLFTSVHPNIYYRTIFFDKTQALFKWRGRLLMQTPTRYEKQKARYSFSISLCGAL